MQILPEKVKKIFEKPFSLIYFKIWVLQLFDKTQETTSFSTENKDEMQWLQQGRLGLVINFYEIFFNRATATVKHWELILSQFTRNLQNYDVECAAGKYSTLIGCDNQILASDWLLQDLLIKVCSQQTQERGSQEDSSTQMPRVWERFLTVLQLENSLEDSQVILASDWLTETNTDLWLVVSGFKPFVCQHESCNAAFTTKQCLQVTN